MKKSIIIFLSPIIILITGVSVYLFYDNNHIAIKEEQKNEEKPLETNKETEIKTEVEVKKLQNIKNMTIAELETNIAKKENFILVITQTSCGACIAYKPVLDEILINYNLIAYEIDIRTLSDEEYHKLNEIITVEYTPTTLFFKEGIKKEAQTLIGNTEKELIISSLKASEFIK